MSPGFLQTLRDDPATKALLESARGYATAKSGSVLGAATGKLTGDKSVGDAHEGAVEGMQKGKSKIGKLFKGIGGAVKGLFRGKGASKRPTNIVEDMLIGAPVDEVYARWVDYSEHAGYMKAVESVDVDKDGEQEQDKPPASNWKVKVWWSRRTWKAEIVDEEPEHHVRWKTEGAKGTVDGVITFTELVPGLTLMLVVIEYRSKGPFEWTANRWRTAGRRVRLDLKHFRRHVMMTIGEDDGDKDQADESSDDQPEPTPDEDVDSGEQDAPEPTEDTEDGDEPSDAEAAEDTDEPEAAEDAKSGIRKPRKPVGVGRG